MQRLKNRVGIENTVGTGILICGLNGSGKSTLGKSLAKSLHYYFRDKEDLYFPRDAQGYKYAFPRTPEQAENLLFRKIKAHKNFVLASVKGDYGKAVYPFFQYAIWMEAPKELRLQRVKKRSYEKFGDRILPGGDLYEQEEQFFQFAASREENTVEEWIQYLTCPVLKIDGTKPVEENVNFILEKLKSAMI